MPNTFLPSQRTSENAHISSYDIYQEKYRRSIEDSQTFWAETAERLNWIEPWSDVRKFDFVSGEIEWFIGGKLNAAANCIDRHIENGYGDETAIIWEGNDPNQSRTFTYSELLKEVSQFANALKSMGVEKGDRVCLYMQMIPELAFAVLACARIGAVHSVVFAVKVILVSLLTVKGRPVIQTVFALVIPLTLFI